MNLRALFTDNLDFCTRVLDIRFCKAPSTDDGHRIPRLVLALSQDARARIIGESEHLCRPGRYEID